jgi:hypothetical protein
MKLAFLFQNAVQNEFALKVVKIIFPDPLGGGAIAPSPPPPMDPPLRMHPCIDSAQSNRKCKLRLQKPPRAAKVLLMNDVGFCNREN